MWFDRNVCSIFFVSNMFACSIHGLFLSLVLPLISKCDWSQKKQTWRERKEWTSINERNAPPHRYFLLLGIASQPSHFDLVGFCEKGPWNHDDVGEVSLPRQIHATSGEIPKNKMSWHSSWWLKLQWQWRSMKFSCDLKHLLSFCKRQLLVGSLDL